MITCKEDLKFKYVDGNNEELARAFQNILFSFGVKWSIFNDQQVRFPTGGCSSIVFNGETINLVSNEFANEYYDSIESLSDLKPRTKVEYEKVTDSIFDLKDEFENGNLHYNFGDDEWFTYKDEPSFAIGFKECNVYRKVDRPVEWWKDAAEFVNLNNQLEGKINAVLCANGDHFRVRASMTRDQWCDFARILLEQEGE